MELKQAGLNIGDRVITYNAQKGIVTGLIEDREEDTTFALVRLEDRDCEYAYDFSELTKLTAPTLKSSFSMRGRKLAQAPA